MVTMRKAEDPAPDPLDSLIRQEELRTAVEAPQAPAGGPVVADTLEADLLDVLRMLAGMAGPAAWFLTPERFAQLWGEPTLRNIAGPGAEIMRRNGWTMAGLVGKWGPYLALAAAVAPPALATVQAYKLAQEGGPIAPAQAPATAPATGGAGG